MSDQPPNGLGGLDMNRLLGMAQDLQQRMQEAQADLASITATASSGGGLATATVNGEHRLLSLRFDPEVVDKEEVGMLQDLAVAAVNMAMQRVEEQLKERMGEVTGGLQMPFPIPGMGG